MMTSSIAKSCALNAKTCGNSSNQEHEIYDASKFDSLEAYIDAMNDFLKEKTAQEIIQWTYESFGEQAVMSSSFGIHSATMLNLVSQVNKKIPVIWIDTGYLPVETYQFTQQLTQQLELNLKVYQSPISPARMEALYGKLWEKGTVEAHKQYGFLRKVEPMQRALKELHVKALMVGVRADQTDHRSTMRIVNFYDGRLKICPILKWSKKEVEAYMESNKLPYHPLKYQGYESVGDAHSSRPLTKEDQENGNERAGRFHGVSQECGLHIDMDANKFMEELVVTTNPEQTNELFISKHLTEKIVIYSKPTCKYCLTAKQVFKENNWDFTEFTVGTDITIQALQQIVGKDVKTVPQIFMEGEYIGGYTDLCAKLDIPSRFA